MSSVVAQKLQEKERVGISTWATSSRKWEKGQECLYHLALQKRRMFHFKGW
jgi:hypothetical protein